MTPTKQVDSVDKLQRWQRSQAFAEVVGFIMQASDKIKSKPLSCKRNLSEKVNAIRQFLTQAKEWLKEIPPHTQAMRFGNKAFRDWHARLVQEARPFLVSLVGPELVAAGAVEELLVYLTEAFGSVQRIDYGTGHELNFVAWLTVLKKMGVVGEEDLVPLVLDVFTSYLECMRELQSVYWLEPAGSKGVWGLDDYQFLPFLWGSSQLSGWEEDVPPSAICNKDVVDSNADEHIFMAAIKFINTMKSGLFWEHSPLLNDISGVPSWRKVNQGLIKMYNKEVLSKFPVVQHFYFGSVLTLEECPEDHPMRAKRTGMKPRV